MRSKKSHKETSAWEIGEGERKDETSPRSQKVYVCIRFLLGFDHCACTIPSEQPSAAQGPETFRSRYAIPVPA